MKKTEKETYSLGKNIAIIPKLLFKKKEKERFLLSPPMHPWPTFYSLQEIDHSNFKDEALNSPQKKAERILIYDR